MNNKDFQCNDEYLQKYDMISSMISKILDEIIFDYETDTDTLNLYIKEDEKDWKYFIINEYVRLNKMEKAVFPDDLDRYKEMLRTAKDKESGKYFGIELRMKPNPLKSSEYKWYRMTYSVISYDDRTTDIIGRIVYIDDEKRREEYIVNRNRIDALTSFLNKDNFQKDVEEYIRGPGKDGHHVMLSVDIDNMGVINSVFGYVFADTIIRDVAETVKSVFRTTDLTARTGGDEFTVFIKNINYENAINKAEELCKKIRRKYKTQSRMIDVTSSIAVAFYPDDGRYYDVITKNLDSAMAAAKKVKNTTVCFNNNMSADKRPHDIKSHIRFHSIQDYDIEFFAYTFSLMTNSMDINTSVNMLLEQMGKHFNLSGISVLEMWDYKNKTKYITNRWDKNEGIIDIDADETKKTMKFNMEAYRYDDNDMICIDDTDKAGKIYNGNKIIDSIKSMVICRFNDNVINQGNVAFYDSEKKRVWTPFEKGTFYEVSRLLSVFLTMRRRHDNDEKIIRKYVQFDMLTNLLKPDSFEERVRKKLDKKPDNIKAAIIYADIYNFSYVNENFGYDKGDEMLVEFADILLSMGSNVTASRPYSDYFIIYYEGENVDDILDDISKRKEDWFEKQKKAYPAANLRISTGIYFIENKDEDVKLAIENANLARKHFKGNENIKNEIYTRELRSYRIYEQQVCSELHDDIAGGYLELYLQPKFSLDKRTVIGAEALARWRNKDGSYKFPGDFVPVLEKVGYIVDLDFFMYETVLKYMRRWIDQGKNIFPISINFSRIHNHYENFVERVIELADKYEVDRKLIEIETTESAMFNNEGVMLENLKRLHEKGFLIAIDDFGTGFSSLNMIFTAPFDVVKVDKSILSKNISDRDRKYIKRLIDLIYDVEKEVIFEGVETEEQAELLLSCGCIKAQGWLFDKAIPVDEFEKKYII
ncbi:MAG: EAL domain-containing protein [Oscillospiraceae bacterium]|nr:EAL domain-containing protein [Oscillospiraceae bacterium]